MWSSFIQSLGWTLVHSIWQGAILFLLLQLLLKNLKSSPAKIRYALSSLALAGIFISFLITFYLQWESARLIGSVTTPPVALHPEETVGLFHPVANTGAGVLFSGNWLLYVVGLYAIGLLLFTGKFFTDLYLMRKLRHARITPFDSAWEKYVDKLSKAWNISQKVGLYLSEKVEVPIVIGYLKPVIYLPFSIANNLPSEQIETILLHELAHIKRADFVINLLQTIVETILFFNPFVWFITNKIRKERELACDELVIAEKEPGIYAKSLLALAEARFNKGKFVMAAAGKKHRLLYRIKHMMEKKTEQLNITQKLLVVAFVITATLSISWLIPNHKSTILQKHKEEQPTTVVVTPKVVSDTIPPQVPHPPVLKSTIQPPLPPTPRDTNPPVPSPTGLQNPPSPPSRKFPAPPVPPDSIPAADSIISSVTANINSRTTNLNRYFNSKDWNNYKKALKKYKSDVKSYVHSKAFQDYIQSMKKYASKLQKQFKSEDWQQKMDSFRYAINVKMPNLDSVFSAKNLHFNNFAPSVVTYTTQNGNKTTQVNNLIRRLKQDGLLTDENNYKIRLNDNGLFINGKKQPDSYYKKYRKLVGQHTEIKVKKEKDKYSTSISTSN